MLGENKSQRRSEREERLEPKDEQAGSPREMKGERVEGKINRDEEETIKEELKTWSSQAPAAEEREERRVMMGGGGFWAGDTMP